MSKHRFTANLSVKSIEKLIQDLEKYRDGELQLKCEELTRRLILLGCDMAISKVSENPVGKYVTVTTNISSEKMKCNGVLLAKGQVMEHEGYAPFNILLAIEFGAGSHYNPIPNPLSAQSGYGVGTFPGQTHAFDPNGWYYWDEENEEWRHSYGLKATMPIYNADIEIIKNVARIAREVFG